MVYERRRRVRPYTPDGVSPWPFVGMVLVACDFFLAFASILVAPWWATLLLVVGWLVLMRLSVSWWTPHPRRIVGGSVVFAAIWFTVLVAGGALLGWTTR